MSRGNLQVEDTKISTTYTSNFAYSHNPSYTIGDYADLQYSRQLYSTSTGKQEAILQRKFAASQALKNSHVKNSKYTKPDLNNPDVVKAIKKEMIEKAKNVNIVKKRVELNTENEGQKRREYISSVQPISLQEIDLRLEELRKQRIEKESQLNEQFVRLFGSAKRPRRIVDNENISERYNEYLTKARAVLESVKQDLADLSAPPPRERTDQAKEIINLRKEELKSAIAKIEVAFNNEAKNMEEIYKEVQRRVDLLVKTRENLESTQKQLSIVTKNVSDLVDSIEKTSRKLSKGKYADEDSRQTALSQIEINKSMLANVYEIKTTLQNLAQKYIDDIIDQQLRISTSQVQLEDASIRFRDIIVRTYQHEMHIARATTLANIRNQRDELVESSHKYPPGDARRLEIERQIVELNHLINFLDKVREATVSADFQSMVSVLEDNILIIKDLHNEVYAARQEAYALQNKASEQANIRIRTLQEENDYLRQRISNIQRKQESAQIGSENQPAIEALETTLNQKDQTIHNLQQQLLDMRNSIKNSDKERDEMSQKLETYTQIFNIVNSGLKNQNNGTTIAQQIRERTTRDVNKSESDYLNTLATYFEQNEQTHASVVRNLKSNITTMEQEIQHLLNAINDQTNEISQLTRSEMTTRSELQTAQNDIDDLKTRGVFLSKGEVGAYETQINTLKQKIEVNDQLITRIFDMYSESTVSADSINRVLTKIQASLSNSPQNIQQSVDSALNTVAKTIGDILKVNIYGKDAQKKIDQIVNIIKSQQGSYDDLLEEKQTQEQDFTTRYNSIIGNISKSLAITLKPSMTSEEINRKISEALNTRSETAKGTASKYQIQLGELNLELKQSRENFRKEFQKRIEQTVGQGEMELEGDWMQDIADIIKETMSKNYEITQLSQKLRQTEKKLLEAVSTQDYEKLSSENSNLKIDFQNIAKKLRVSPSIEGQQLASKVSERIDRLNQKLTEISNKTQNDQKPSIQLQERIDLLVQESGRWKNKAQLYQRQLQDFQNSSFRNSEFQAELVKQKNELEAEYHQAQQLREREIASLNQKLRGNQEEIIRLDRQVTELEKENRVITRNNEALVNFLHNDLEFSFETNDDGTLRISDNGGLIIENSSGPILKLQDEIAASFYELLTGLGIVTQQGTIHGRFKGNLGSGILADRNLTARSQLAVMLGSLERFEQNFRYGDRGYVSGTQERTDLEKRKLNSRLFDAQIYCTVLMVQDKQLFQNFVARYKSGGKGVARSFFDEYRSKVDEALNNSLKWTDEQRAALESYRNDILNYASKNFNLAIDPHTHDISHVAYLENYFANISLVVDPLSGNYTIKSPFDENMPHISQ